MPHHQQPHGYSLGQVTCHSRSTRRTVSVSGKYVGTAHKTVAISQQIEGTSHWQTSLLLPQPGCMHHELDTGSVGQGKTMGLILTQEATKEGHSTNTGSTATEDAYKACPNE